MGSTPTPSAIFQKGRQSGFKLTIRNWQRAAKTIASNVTMTPAPENEPTSPYGFQTTHWSVVLKAQRRHEEGSQESLARLCTAYWYPVYAFVRRQGADAHQAEDMTQGFFCHILERETLARVEPEGGKFRSFLLVCLKNYLANERERAQAQRRGGGQLPIPLEMNDAETRYVFERADEQTPDVIYERRWAFAVIEQALERLRSEYTSSKKQTLFEDLQGFLPGGNGSESRSELAAKRGVTVGAINVAVHRLRHRFGALLREQVAQTVDSNAEIEEELRHLIKVLAT